jgi:hypothetical protein
MTWEEHCRLWFEARHPRGPDGEQAMRAARKRLAQNTPDDWQWLTDALDHPQRRWFVAEIFRLHPVPRRFLSTLLRAGVLEWNPSANRRFIEPCVRCLGVRRVLEELLRYLETGTDAEKAGAASALYWARDNPRGEDVTELEDRLRCRLLQEFVGNPDVDVRRRIIPGLQLEPEVYPEELRPLIPVAIGIARSHPDEYIRHRVEVQLGAGGLLKPIPNTEAGPPERRAAPDRGSGSDPRKRRFRWPWR